MSSPTNPSSVLAISKSSSLIVIGRNDEGGGAGKGGWILITSYSQISTT